MVSLDAETGIPDPEFGENGIVDLYQGLRNADDPHYRIRILVSRRRRL